MCDPKLTCEEESQLQKEIDAALEDARERKEWEEVNSCQECREMFR